MDKQFTAIYTKEAENELKNLDKQNQKRVLRTVAVFEQLGKNGINSRPLNKEGLFELKSDKVRIYFMYQENSIIIIGLITLKKTQKAPERYKEIAINRIKKAKSDYLKNGQFCIDGNDCNGERS